VTQDAKIALVTGGNRGLGFETGRQLAELGHTVVLGSRDPARGADAVGKLETLGLVAESVALDVTHAGSATDAVDEVISRHGRLDVLVNNAGIRLDMGRLLDAADDVMTEMLAVNVVAQLRMAQLVVPHMQQNGYGRIVNVSSMLGQMSSMGGGQGTYRVSKACLNAVTNMLAVDIGPGPVKINSASPGWTRTDMGGSSAARSVEEGADTIVWLATLPPSGPTGGFFHDRKLIDW
jgi:NAD(P)-dependent dehydrogenase (short-subunit alcohol dehydrogenase family)